ncbi:hypothetical protein ACHAXM_002893 [Skeletonema potamos]
MDAVTKTRIRTAGIYIPLLTGTLSVIGSGSILYSIWARRATKLKDPQHRILGMMSIFDILYSVNKALMFLTYPSGLGVPTFGNDATCSLQGFFTQFAYATGTYNLVLSVYYYLIINKGMKKEDFAKKWEKILHGIVCNPDVECRFEYTAAYFYEAFAQGWIQVAYVVIIVTNLLIWLYVRKQEKEMDKYRTQLAQDQLSDMEKKSSYARSVFIQSILYVGAFFLSWSWATIFHLYNWITEDSVAWITLLINTFLPLQGFFNAFIYARPRYIRLKKRNGNLTFKQLIKLVFLPEEERGRSTMRVGRDSTSREMGEESDRTLRESSKKHDSGVFKSFLKSMNMKVTTRAPSVTAILEEEGGSEQEKTNVDENTNLSHVDEEEGKSDEGVGANGDDWAYNQRSPAVDDEEATNDRTKSVEWADMVSPAVDEQPNYVEASANNPSPPTSPSTANANSD